MDTTADIFGTILYDLKSLAGVESSTVTSKDGLLIYSTIPQKQSAEIFAAMAATMLEAAKTVSKEIGKGIPERVIVESRHSTLIGKEAGTKALLLIMIEQSANLELILAETDKASEKLIEFFR